MENDKAWARYAKLQIMIGKMILAGNRRLEDFNDVQQNFVENPRWSAVERTTSAAVKSGQMFALLEQRLEEGGRIDVELSLNVERVRGWIANPSTFPIEYKGKVVFLWGSTRSPNGNDQVAYLVWNHSQVQVDWVLTRARIFRQYPRPYRS